MCFSRFLSQGALLKVESCSTFPNACCNENIGKQVHLHVILHNIPGNPFNNSATKLQDKLQRKLPSMHVTGP